jgi:hypothetical protein
VKRSLSTISRDARLCKTSKGAAASVAVPNGKNLKDGPTPILLSQRNVKSVSFSPRFNETKSSVASLVKDTNYELTSDLGVPAIRGAMTRNLRLVLLCGLLFVPCLAFARGQARIRIGKVTLRAGMAQEEALRSLRRSHDLSVVEDHANAYLIKDAKNGELLGTLEFEQSKLISASKNWSQPSPAKLVSAPFANAVFEALADLTGHERSSCTVVTSDADPLPLSVTNTYSGEAVYYPAPGSCGSGCSNNHAHIICGKKTATIDDVTVHSLSSGFDVASVSSHVSVSLNYKGGPLRNGNKTVDGYKGAIRVGNVTVYEGLPEEQALQLLRGSPGISASKVYEVPTLGQSWIFIAGADTHTLMGGPNGYECDDGSRGCPLTSWSVLFEESKIWSVSKFWILSHSDQLASAPFADAVFEALNNLTGRFSLSVACTVETAITDPNVHDSATRSGTANDSLSVIKHINISCGEKQVGVSIGTTASGNDSSVDIAESIFAK